MKVLSIRSSYKGFLPIWILPILLTLAIFNVLYLFKDSTRFGAAVDLRPLYCATHLWMAGENPYDDAKIKAEWQKVPDSEKANLLQPPGFPFFPMVYPPTAIPLIAPFALLPWKYAAIAWYCFNLLLLFGMVYFISGWLSEDKSWHVFIEVLLLLLAFKGTIVAFSTGQPAFLCLFAGFGSLYFHQKGKTYLPAFLLGICTFKISLVIPFLLFFLIKKNYKIVVFSAVVSVILFLITVMPSPIGTELIPIYSNTLKIFRELVFTSPFNKYRDRLTEFGVIAKALNWGSWEQISVVYFVFILFTLIFLKLTHIRKKLNDKYLYILLSLTTFCTIHHTYYDLMGLVPIVYFADKFSVHWKWLFYLLLIRLMVPFNILLYKYRVATELFYHSLPFTILLLYAMFLMLPLKKSASNPLCLNN